MRYVKYDPNENESGNNRGCLMIVGVIAVLFVVLMFAQGPSSRASSTPDPGGACMMAEKFIKDRLKSPTSAEFNYRHCRENAYLTNNTWTLNSYVDADNSFGAHIRTYYFARLSNVPPSDTWHLIELTFEEP